MTISDFLTGDGRWYRVIDRFVVAFEKIADSYDIEYEADDLERRLMEVVWKENKMVADRLQTILAETDQFKKANDLRRMFTDAENRSAEAVKQLESLHGQESKTRIG